MGPPDAVMKEVQGPESVQPEVHTSEGQSIDRRTSAAASYHSQATLPTSNSTARGHPGAGNLGQLEVQLANYIAEVMSARSDRTFAFGATVQFTKMRLTYYSRSTYVISEEIDILEQPELFAVFLILFSMQTLEKLGFNTEVKFCDPFDTKREESKPLAVKLDAINGGDNLELKSDTVLELGGCIHTEYCLMGRATVVYDVKRPEGCEVDLVLKLSWQKKGKRREDKAILIARDVDAEHSPEIYGVAVLGEISPSASFKTACETAPTKPSGDFNPPDERELRILLMRKYSNVEDLEDKEFCAIIPQFLVCTSSYLYPECVSLLTCPSTVVHKLFSEKELLHRDISIFNMAYYEKDNWKIATLIDFDLATFPEGTEARSETAAEPAPPEDNALAAPTITHPRPEDRSGTTPFMAIETLDLDSPGYKHHLCHELESIFYVVIWHAVGYRHKKGIYPTKENRKNTERKKIDVLRGWRTGNWAVVKSAKIAFIYSPRDVIQLIISSFLKIVVARLVRIFTKRHHIYLLSYLEQVIADETKMLEDLEYEALLNEPLPEPEDQSTKIAIFPEFASAWGIKGLECKKSCCVE